MCRIKRCSGDLDGLIVTLRCRSCFNELAPARTQFTTQFAFRDDHSGPIIFQDDHDGVAGPP